MYLHVLVLFWHLEGVVTILYSDLLYWPETARVIWNKSLCPMFCDSLVICIYLFQMVLRNLLDVLGWHMTYSAVCRRRIRSWCRRATALKTLWGSVCEALEDTVTTNPPSSSWGTSPRALLLGRSSDHWAHLLSDE